MPQAALRRCSGAPISAYLADSVPAIVSAMVGAIRGGTGASPRLGRTRDTVSWRGDPDLSASTEGRVLRVVPGGNESGEGRTEVQRASTVRCAMLYRVDREGELRSSGGSRTSQKRQSNTTGKLDSHRVASSRSTPRSTDTLHRTPPVGVGPGTVRAVQRPTRSANRLLDQPESASDGLPHQWSSVVTRSANRLLDHAAAPRPMRLSHTPAQLQVAGTGLGRADHDRRLIASLIRFRYRPRPSAHLPRSLATVARLASQIHLPDVTTLSQI